MTREELNFIKDAFSQIIDDIAGNPDWGDAAKAVASDLGTLERKLEKRVTELPSNLDEAAKKWKEEHFRREYYQIPKDAMSCSFKAGAEWMAGQREAFDGIVRDDGFIDFDEYGSSMMLPSNASCFNNGDMVVVQIRKK